MAVLPFSEEVESEDNICLRFDPFFGPWMWAATGVHTDSRVGIRSAFARDSFVGPSAVQGMKLTEKEQRRLIGFGESTVLFSTVLAWKKSDVNTWKLGYLVLGN